MKQLPCGCLYEDGVYYFVSKNANICTRNLYSRPGRLIKVDRPMHVPIKRDGQTVYMTPESAHGSGLIGCLHYQWLRLVRYLKGLRGFLLARTSNRSTRH